MIFSPFSFRNTQVSSLIPTGYLFYYDVNSDTTYPGSGTTLYDLSGNGYNATLTNGPTYTSTSPRYFSFDGSNDFANVTNSGSYGSDTSSFTTAAWFRFGTLNTAKGIATRGRDGGSCSWSLYIGATSGNKAGFSVVTLSPTTQRDCNGTTTLSTNTWYFVVGRWESGVGLKIYLNGVNEATTTTTATTLRACTTNIWDFGRVNTVYANADISQIVVYNKVLTDTEITNFFNATKSLYGY